MQNNPQEKEQKEQRARSICKLRAAFATRRG